MKLIQLGRKATYYKPRCYCKKTYQDRSNKSNAERVMEQNFAALLFLMPDGHKFKVASDGRIIIKISLWRR